MKEKQKIRGLSRQGVTGSGRGGRKKTYYILRSKDTRDTPDLAEKGDRMKVA